MSQEIKNSISKPRQLAGIPGIIDDRGFNQVYAPCLAMELRTLRRCDALIKEIDLNHAQSILEVGCGTGELSHLIASRTGAHVTGIDLCRPFIDQANASYQKSNLSYRFCDASEPDWTSSLGQKFDCIIGNGILHHLYYQMDETLVRLRNILEPDGKIIFWEPNLSNPYVYLIFSYGFLRRAARLEPAEMAFTAGFMKKKLSQAGFKSISVTCRDFLLPNTPSWMIQPVIRVGAILERLPILRSLSQSLFISAQVGGSNSNGKF